MNAGNQRVMVAVRVRPINRDSHASAAHAQEKFELQGVHRTGDTSIKVELTKPGEPAKSTAFNFDYIFDQESTQLEVYEDSVVDMVDAALVGINATLLAYGQTGSGKTYTILGDVKPNPLENDLLTSESGMFLRVLSDLMDYKIRQKKKGWHVVVGLSCMEIYTENIRDLFGGAPGSPPPPLKAVMIGDDVLLPSLIVKEMTSLQAVFNEIQLAISRRASRATESNATSSRSHCLFSIDILQQADSAPPPSLEVLDQSKKDSGVSRKAGAAPAVSPTSKNGKGALPKGSVQTPTTQNPENLQPYEMPFHGSVLRLQGQKEPIYASKMILADLAGSERISRSGVSGQGQKEATSINSSLTALGNVVHSLHEGGYVNYRDSNLTRLLKPTFSQSFSRVLLLAQCSPTQLTYEETVSTLHFANKVKAMKVTTSTGAEAEKLMFDYLEVERTYDGLLADLHIFALDQHARPAVIHRKMTQNKGLYYDAVVGKSGGKKSSGGTGKERRAALDANGAVSLAQQERVELLARLEKEKQDEIVAQQEEIAETRAKLAAEHKASMEEAKEGITSETERRARHDEQLVLAETAASGNAIMGEEGAEWAELMSRFMKDHKLVVDRDLKESSKTVENMSKEVNLLHLASASHEIPETTEDNKEYAVHAWGHCTAQRFFSSCMELRESQLLLLSLSGGNANLEKWQVDNKDLLDKFESEKA